MERDRLGRRRRPGQERGLRPLHPRLPGRWSSRVLRVAMSQADWDRFDGLVQSVVAHDEPETQARAHGEVIAGLLDAAAVAPPPPGPLDWMDWEREKTLRLLRLQASIDFESEGLTLPGPLDWLDWERRKALRLLRVRPEL